MDWHESLLAKRNTAMYNEQIAHSMFHSFVCSPVIRNFLIKQHKCKSYYTVDDRHRNALSNSFYDFPHVTCDVRTETDALQHIMRPAVWVNWVMKLIGAWRTRHWSGYNVRSGEGRSRTSVSRCQLNRCPYVCELHADRPSHQC